MQNASPKSPLRLIREVRGLTLEQVVSALGVIEQARAVAGSKSHKWDTGGLSRAERDGVKTPLRAAQLVAFFGSGITEMELLFPDRFYARISQP